MKERPIMTTKEQFEQRVRESAPLAERLQQCYQRIGKMCSEGRPPRMSIPLQWDDDDFFISTTLQDALIDVRRLDSGKIETHDRDEFGEEVTCICSGVDLRRSIDAAVIACLVQEAG
jgi:hypothetical protein